MNKFFILSFIFSFSIPTFSEKIVVTRIESEVKAASNEEKIKKNLEALEQIEKSKVEEAEKKAEMKLNEPKKVSDNDIYEPLESIGVKVEKNDSIKNEMAKIKNEDSATPKVESKMESKTESKTVIEKTKDGVRISIRNLQFESDSAKLLKGEEKRLDEIAKILKSHPKSKFLVEGHTARIGTIKNEKWLSEMRAKTVVTALSKRGVPSKNMIIKGHGGSKPIATNKTKAGRAQNRRVEITILN